MCMPTCISPSGSQCHCGACHHTFSDVAAFDDHRVNGKCDAGRTRGRVGERTRGTAAARTRAPQGGTRVVRIPEGRALNGRRLSS